jgi:hypothetical protein
MKLPDVDVTLPDTVSVLNVIPGTTAFPVTVSCPTDN